MNGTMSESDAFYKYVLGTFQNFHPTIQMIIWGVNQFVFMLLLEITVSLLKQSWTIPETKFVYGVSEIC